MYSDFPPSSYSPALQKEISSVMGPIHKSSVLHIDSRFSSSVFQSAPTPFGSNAITANSTTIELAEPIKDVSRLIVESVDIPITFYNISAALRNNTALLYVSTETNNANKLLLTVPDGYYNAASLAAAFQTALNALVDGLTVSASIIAATKQCQISVNEITGTYYLEWGEPVLTNQTSYTLGFVLGFREVRTLLTEGEASISLAPCMPNSVLPHLFLAIEDFANPQQNQVMISLGGANRGSGVLGEPYLTTSNVLAKVVIPASGANSASFGDRIMSQEGCGLITGVRKYSPGTTIRKLRVSWLDALGNSVYMNQIPFSISLRVESS